MVTKFKLFIKNSFRYHTLTNGPIEGINNTIICVRKKRKGDQATISGLISLDSINPIGHRA
ncbi:hypothetical protein ACQV2R_08570 [Facklamia sp. P12937]|uniref:hypothetical protein n=1 Tax=Facklamia sp. P12937 TaxID=3421949 RepID=UPI003D1733C4